MLYACAALLAPLAGSAAAHAADASPFVTNGPVYAVTSLGGTSYVGGEFSEVARRSGPGVVLRTDGDNATLRETSFAEFAGGEVKAAAPDGAGGWYVGGSFTAVGGHPIAGLAHLRGDGTVDTAFDPRPRMRDGSVGVVKAIAVGPAGSVDEGVVYVGGEFERIGGRDEPHLAAVGQAGDILGWSSFPRPLGDVNALAIMPLTVTLTAGVTRQQSVLFVGGDFGANDGALPGQITSAGIAAVWGDGAQQVQGEPPDEVVQDVGGSQISWAPATQLANVRAIALGPTVVKPGTAPAPATYHTTVYIGRASTTDRLRAYRFDIRADGYRSNPPSAPQTATRYDEWNPAPDGPVRALALAPDNSTLYVGGDFTKLKTTVVRRGVAASRAIGDPSCTSGCTPSVPDGAPTAWDPAAKVEPGPSPRALAVSADGATVYVGGVFTQLGAGDAPPAREGLAAIRSDSGEATAWDPGLSGGHVEVLSATGTHVFAGGSFSGVAGVERNNLAAFDLAGDLTAWNPGTDQPVRALAAQGTTVFAGGAFEKVAGHDLRHLAAIDQGGNPSPGFAPNPDGAVLALSATSDALYVGGGFARIAERDIHNLAALHPATGTVLPTWTTEANDNVYSLDASCSKVYAAGAFTKIGQEERGRLAQLDPVTGAPTQWDPKANSAVFAVRARGDTVYAGGRFSLVGLEPRSHLAALSASTAKATGWNPSPDLDSVRALAVDATTVYAGGIFAEIGGAARRNVAALDPISGQATAWNGDADGPVYALFMGNGVLRVGGAFSNLGTLTQQGFGAFPTGTPADAEADPCTPPPPPPPPPAPRSLPPPPPPGAPVLDLFAIRDKVFRVGRAATIQSAARTPRRIRRRPPVGTAFRWRVDSPATLIVTIESEETGYVRKGKTGNRCVRMRKPPKRAKRCKLRKSVGTLSRVGTKGTNQFSFSGRLGKRALAPGKYVASAVATNIGLRRSKTRRVTFTVAR